MKVTRTFYFTFPSGFRIRRNKENFSRRFHCFYLANHIFAKVKPNCRSMVSKLLWVIICYMTRQWPGLGVVQVVTVTPGMSPLAPHDAARPLSPASPSSGRVWSVGAEGGTSGQLNDRCGGKLFCCLKTISCVFNYARCVVFRVVCWTHVTQRA